MSVNVNLNIHWNAPEHIWEKVRDVFQSMEGFQEESSYPLWVIGDYVIEASREPSGLQLYSTLPEDLWCQWYGGLKEKLSKALGYEIGEPEEGFDFKLEF